MEADISILRKTGHFYFALTRRNDGLKYSRMSAAHRRKPKMESPILEHYGKEFAERDRLEKYAQLEFFRTKEIISRHLPKKPTVVLDIGGGPGHYALWLAKLGHSACLVDPVPLHVRQAEDAFRSAGQKRKATATVGDARNLQFEDATAGAVLLLGPLYHLVKRADRVKALSEAWRALKPGGWLFAAVISRFASAFDGLFRNFAQDPAFFRILQQDLRNGQHRNPAKNPRYFTTAFFHHPDELRNEVEAAGFGPPKLYGLEGPGWLMPDLGDVWSDRESRERLLAIVRAMEREPTLIGQSAHILAVARKR
jgi:ubiquinone/menaquinone biosynthesis C-methylase UbiE